MKEVEGQFPIAVVLRKPLRAVVEAIRSGALASNAPIPMVRPVTAETARQIEEYICDYGERVARLPEASWETSVSMWSDGYWDLLVDLWTEEAGRSDLVLAVRVHRDGLSYILDILGVYVP